MTEFESRSADWVSVDEALARVLSVTPSVTTELVPLRDALGRALASPVIARATLPPWDNSSMDGYAVRAQDVQGASSERPARLPVTGVGRAGAGVPPPLPPGTAYRIMTGAPVPPGADCVIRVEDTDREREQPGHVHVRSDRDSGRNVRPGGQDMRSGEEVLSAGTTLGPGHLAVAAAAGAAALQVYGRPRVAILSNGDELREHSRFEDVRQGLGVPETNGLMLASAVAAAGALGLAPRLAPDDPAVMRELLLQSMDADLLVTTGGASMGEADLFKRVLDEMGLELEFWRVTLRPGSPMSFGFLPRADRPRLPVFGLPGNPASAFVTFELFVRPCLLRAGGHRRLHRRVVRARAQEPFPATGHLTHFHRVLVGEDGSRFTARLTGPQGSGLVRSLGSAQGLAVIPIGLAQVAAGEEIEVILFDDGLGASELPGFRSSRR